MISWSQLYCHYLSDNMNVCTVCYTSSAALEKYEIANDIAIGTRNIECSGQRYPTSMSL